MTKLQELKSQWYDIFMEGQRLQQISEHLNQQIGIETRAQQQLKAQEDAAASGQAQDTKGTPPEDHPPAEQPES